MRLRMILEQPLDRYWDGGTKQVVEFAIDGLPRYDAHGAYIRIGSWGANTWFHVALGKTAKSTLANARRRLVAQAKHARRRCHFTYIDDPPNTFERRTFDVRLPDEGLGGCRRKE